jgi:hypothetical protein
LVAKKPVVEDAPIDEVPEGVDVLEPEVAPAPITLLFSKDGVLLNASECVVGADGVIRGK